MIPFHRRAIYAVVMQRTPDIRCVAVFAALAGAILSATAFGQRPPRDEAPDYSPPRPVMPYDHRGVMLAHRNAALARGDLESAAAAHGLMAREALLRVRAVHVAWMGLRNQRSPLFPESPRRLVWNYRNAVADFFAFQMLAAMETDSGSFPLLRETMRAEAALAGPGALCPPARWDTGDPVEASHDEMLFGMTEYAKDGLMGIVEHIG